MSGTVGDNIYRASGVIAAASGGGVSWQSVVTASTFTAEAGNGYPVNTTSNACTVTLPASASVGDEIIFTDYARNFDTNALTIDQNSLNYQGGTSPNPEYDTAGESIHIVYVDATKGWIPTYDGAVVLETPQPVDAYYLVVAGGGSGGKGLQGPGYGRGGGGAGGYRTNFGGSAYSLSPGVVYSVTVGTGGAGGSSGQNNGVDSTFTGSDITDITSTGGGGGGNDSLGSAGGSGGGGGHLSAAGGAGNTPSTSPAQGFDGGDSSASSGGGGGGASEVGEDAPDAETGGDGGDGTSNAITGSGVSYAGGGGAGGNADNAPGGAGGGGVGFDSGSGGATDGTDAFGGGGGGGGYLGAPSGNCGAGGDGVVFLRVPTASYTGTISGSPTVTTDGTDTIMKFTASTGTYTA